MTIRFDLLDSFMRAEGSTLTKTESNLNAAWYPVDDTGECLRFGVKDNAPYEELSCLYPAYGKTYFEFEKTGMTKFHENMWDFMRRNPWLAYFTCALYWLGIVFGRRYFANRPAWNCRKALAAWNLGLAIFSFVGFARTAPQLAHNIYYYGWKNTLDSFPHSSLGQGSSCFWVLAFVLSKFVELIDTLFIVVHKKKLLFLHWYHHITVLLFCWHGWIALQPMGLIFCVVNYGVHSIMYFYYYLMAVKRKPKWFNPQVITVVQILQMVVGVRVCAQSWHLAKEPGSFVDKRIIMAGFVMYASYLALFMQFFVNRYLVLKKVKHS
ncbi:of very long chain fatty acids protein 6 [Seminavis robusta]|uniref:Elongation of fatty acids protein n=1 Tax=Seminavis robusta TaxID=568900 RepID=A0A9N8E2C3_9STRA|nr:of very long chain fatty acids protein 6 [Seminavis robusta]|eukprot:Sro435_g142460.1 of very long chain fatty acids protein 6 (323) ;mRNA; f:64047-65078